MLNAKDHDQLLRLTALIKETVDQDTQLREKYKVGNKFRFIHERLEELLQKLQQGGILLDSLQRQANTFVVNEDEVLVYVHLYNAQEGSINSWQNIINPKAFIDYSINRPVYKNRAAVDAFINSKSNRKQHGYLIIAIKRDCILGEEGETFKDSIGQPLLKIKEGSLSYQRLQSFVYNQEEYKLTAAGNLIKR